MIHRKSRKLHTGLRLVPKWVTLNDSEWRYGRSVLFFSARQTGWIYKNVSQRLSSVTVPYCATVHYSVNTLLNTGTIFNELTMNVNNDAYCSICFFLIFSIYLLGFRISGMCICRHYFNVQGHRRFSSCHVFLRFCSLWAFSLHL